MTHHHAETDAELRTALEDFESCLATPIVGGELVAWVNELQAAWAAVVPLVRSHSRELHPRQYGEISDVDPALLPTVEKLKKEDAAIDEACEEWGRQLDRLATHAPKFEPDEQKIEEHTAQLIEEGIAVVNRVRKQEVALQTWFMEAFNRDRGVAD